MVFCTHHWLASGPTNKWACSGTKSNLAWYHVVSVVSKTTGFIKIYINGVEEDTDTFTAGSAAFEYGTLPWRIGIFYTRAGRLCIPGERQYPTRSAISTIARDACWIETAHSNQKEGSSFTTVGDEIVLGKFENRKQITINVSQRGSSCTGSLSNFPVLINLSGDWLKTKADGGSLYSSKVMTSFSGMQITTN